MKYNGLLQKQFTRSEFISIYNQIYEECAIPSHDSDFNIYGEKCLHKIKILISQYFENIESVEIDCDIPHHLSAKVESASPKNVYSPKDSFTTGELDNLKFNFNKTIIFLARLTRTCQYLTRYYLRLKDESLLQIFFSICWEKWLKNVETVLLLEIIRENKGILDIQRQYFDPRKSTIENPSQILRDRKNNKKTRINDEPVIDFRKEENRSKVKALVHPLLFYYTTVCFTDNLAVFKDLLKIIIKPFDNEPLEERLEFYNKMVEERFAPKKRNLLQDFDENEEDTIFCIGYPEISSLLIHKLEDIDEKEVLIGLMSVFMNKNILLRPLIRSLRLDNSFIDALIKMKGKRLENCLEGNFAQFYKKISEIEWSESVLGYKSPFLSYLILLFINISHFRSSYMFEQLQTYLKKIFDESEEFLFFILMIFNTIVTSQNNEKTGGQIFRLKVGSHSGRPLTGNFFLDSSIEFYVDFAKLFVPIIRCFPYFNKKFAKLLVEDVITYKLEISAARLVGEILYQESNDFCYCIGLVDYLESMHLKNEKLLGSTAEILELSQEIESHSSTRTGSVSDNTDESQSSTIERVQSSSTETQGVSHTDELRPNRKTKDFLRYTANTLQTHSIRIFSWANSPISASKLQDIESLHPEIFEFFCQYRTNEHLQLYFNLELSEMEIKIGELQVYGSVRDLNVLYFIYDWIFEVKSALNEASYDFGTGQIEKFKKSVQILFTESIFLKSIREDAKATPILNSLNIFLSNKILQIVENTDEKSIEMIKNSAIVAKRMENITVFLMKGKFDIFDPVFVQKSVAKEVGSSILINQIELEKCKIMKRAKKEKIISESDLDKDAVVYLVENGYLERDGTRLKYIP